MGVGMSNINDLVEESYHPAIAQAALWGLSSALGHHLAERPRRKKMTDEQLKDHRRRMGISLGTGALAGALSTII